MPEGVSVAAVYRSRVSRMNKSKHGKPEKETRYAFKLSSLFLLTTLLVISIAWIVERNNWQVQKNKLLVSIEDAELSSFDAEYAGRFTAYVRGIVQGYVDIGPNCELTPQQELTRSERLVGSLKHLASIEEVAITKILRDENDMPNGLDSQHTMIYKTAWDVIKLLEGTSGRPTSDFSDLQRNNVASFIRRVKSHQDLAGFIALDHLNVPEFKGLGFFEKYLEDNEKEFEGRFEDCGRGFLYESSWEYCWNKNKVPGAKNEIDTVKPEFKTPE